MTTIFVLDDLKEIRGHIKDRLSDIPSLEILDGTRQQLLQRLEAGETLPDPICIITDFYTGSDDMTVLFEGLYPTVTQNVSDATVTAHLAILKKIITAWPKAKVFLFSNFHDSMHFTAEQKLFIKEHLHSSGIEPAQIIPKQPLDPALHTLSGIVRSILSYPHEDRFPPATVLVVEDEENQRITIVDRLERERISVLAASSRKEALSLLHDFGIKYRKVPDCIITDLYMPPERQHAGIKMIDDIKREKATVFLGIMLRLNDLQQIKRELAKVPVIVFSLYAVSDKLDGPQVRKIDQRLDQLQIPVENRIIKTGRFHERLEIVIERLAHILNSAKA